jgi:phenylpyruvate tautomerase PptA (4-oxalocrotonate tautomerase family)
VPLDKSPRIEVVVEEVKSGDWGIGGKPLSTEDVQGSPREHPPPPTAN